MFCHIMDPLRKIFGKTHPPSLEFSARFHWWYRSNIYVKPALPSVPTPFRLGCRRRLRTRWSGSSSSDSELEDCSNDELISRSECHRFLNRNKFNLISWNFKVYLHTTTISHYKSFILSHIHSHFKTAIVGNHWNVCNCNKAETFVWWKYLKQYNI